MSIFVARTVTKTGLTRNLAAVAVFAACGSAAAQQSAQPDPNSARPVHWSYEGNEGPARWGSLSPAYALCGRGTSQSPIDIDHTEAEGEAQLSFAYRDSQLRIAFNQHVNDIVDNGHTIQVNVDEGSTLTVGGKVYELKQFHFHTPSEHTIDGRQFPLEVHFVHQSADESLAVVGVLVEEGAENASLLGITRNLPQTKGETRHLEDETLNLDLHVPQDNGAYLYSGSLTTPPCSEAVQWIVLRAHPTMSAQQIESVSSVIAPNNRPVQRLNGRPVMSRELDD
jgi:carbonic anhydrase